MTALYISAAPEKHFHKPKCVIQEGNVIVNLFIFAILYYVYKINQMAYRNCLTEIDLAFNDMYC
jgi:hypothetical protein